MNTDEIIRMEELRIQLYYDAAIEEWDRLFSSDFDMLRSIGNDDTSTVIEMATGLGEEERRFFARAFVNNRHAAALRLRGEELTDAERQFEADFRKILMQKLRSRQDDLSSVARPFVGKVMKKSDLNRLVSLRMSEKTGTKWIRDTDFVREKIGVGAWSILTEIDTGSTFSTRLCVLHVTSITGVDNSIFSALGRPFERHSITDYTTWLGTTNTQWEIRHLDDAEAVLDSVFNITTHFNQIIASILERLQ